MRRRKPRISKHAYTVFCASLAFATVVLLFTALGKSLRPVITTMSQYQCRVISMLAMNEAVMEVLADSGDVYNTIMITDKADDGSVSAVHINSVEINRFKAKLTDAVSNKLLSIEKQDIAVPLGTLSRVMLPPVALKVISPTLAPASMSMVLRLLSRPE